MTDQEMWPIGTRVKFNYDGLSARGIILRHSDSGYSAAILLDEHPPPEMGWPLTSYHEVDRVYYGKRGWHVPFKYLQRCITKLGNEL